MIATLKEFIRTGTLGPLTLGSDLSSAILVLGAPENISSPQIDPPIAKYGNVELLVPASRIASIEVFLDEDCSTSINLSDLQEFRTLGREMFLRHLEREGIGFRVQRLSGSSSRGMIYFEKTSPGPLGGIVQKATFSGDNIDSLSILDPVAIRARR